VHAARTDLPLLQVDRRWPDRFDKNSLHHAGVGQTYHFTPLSFAENMAPMVLFGLIIALAARSQMKVEKS